MGRDLLARFPGPRHEAVERPVRVMHVTPTEDLEILGLKFSDGKSPPPAPEEVQRAF